MPRLPLLALITAFAVLTSACASAQLPKADEFNLQAVMATATVTTDELYARTNAKHVAPAPTAAPAATPNLEATVQARVQATVQAAASPTPDVAGLRRGIDVAWQAADWPTAFRLLDSAERVAPLALDFKDKRYVAHFSAGLELLERGNRVAAGAEFAAATSVDPARGEARAAGAALTPTVVPATATPVPQRVIVPAAPRVAEQSAPRPQAPAIANTPVPIAPPPAPRAPAVATQVVTPAMAVDAEVSRLLVQYKTDSDRYNFLCLVAPIDLNCPAMAEGLARQKVQLNWALQIRK